MAIEAITWAFAQRIDAPAKFVLVALAYHANPQGGNCWPGIELLAAKTGMHRATVIRALERLMSHGIINKVRRPNKSNTYQLAIDTAVVAVATATNNIDQVAEVAESDRRTEQPPQSQSATPEVAESNLGSRTVRPEPSVTVNEPSVKRQRAHALPPDWQPDDALLDQVRASFPNLDLTYETDSFRDYFHGKGTRYIDWRATFRNWCRRSATKYGRASVHTLRVDGRRRHSYDPYLEALARHSCREAEPRVDQPRLLVIDGGRGEPVS